MSIMKRKKIVFTYHGHSITLPYYIHFTHPQAPSIVITGGMHGDEVNGINIATTLRNHLLHTIGLANILGNIIIIPILNIPWFRTMSRIVPIDNQDLNRSFGFKRPSTFSQAYANFLEQHFFSQAHYGIDIHDAGGRSILYPHARIHLCDNDHCERCSREMWLLFWSKILLARKAKSGMLAEYMQKRYNKPFVTLEVGWGQITKPAFNSLALKGIINILAFYNFINYPVTYHDKKQYVLIERNYYKAKHGGILDLHTRVGKKVVRGDVLGTIYYPTLNRTDEIISQDDGFIFSSWATDQIPAKEKILSILAVWLEDDGTRTGGVLW